MEEENKEIPIEQPQGINSMLKKVLDNQEELIKQKKEKKFKFPWSARLNKTQVKKNCIQVMYLQDNKNVNLLRCPIEDETVTIDGLPRAASIDYVFLLNGKPTLIQPSWSIAPLNIKDNITETEKLGLAAKARKLVFTKMKNDIIVPKKMGGGSAMWIILGIAVIGIGYYLFTGCKLF
jgi:hypothetical protein